MSHRVRGEFIAGTAGPLFVLLREPHAQPRSCVLIVPPFGEEMNKSRRMMTLVSMSLAARGIASVAVDLFGTGDSGGDFVEASWHGWMNDIDSTIRWSAGEGRAIEAAFGIRLGCALAVSCALRGMLPPLRRSVFWQPVFDGNRFLTQLLRMRLAAALAEEDRKESMTEIKATLAAGTPIEVGGYELSPRLAAELEALPAPSELPAQMGEIHWFETIREAGGSLPAPSLRLIEATRQAGIAVQASGFVGEPFWAATEIVENRNMVQATVDLLA